jgi:hypothetical protein
MRTYFFSRGNDKIGHYKTLQGIATFAEYDTKTLTLQSFHAYNYIVRPWMSLPLLAYYQGQGFFGCGDEDKGRGFFVLIEIVRVSRGDAGVGR